MAFYSATQQQNVSRVASHDVFFGCICGDVSDIHGMTRDTALMDNVPKNQKNKNLSVS